MYILILVVHNVILLFFLIMINIIIKIIITDCFDWKYQIQ